MAALEDLQKSSLSAAPMQVHDQSYGTNDAPFLESTVPSLRAAVPPTAAGTDSGDADLGQVVPVDPAPPLAPVLVEAPPPTGSEEGKTGVSAGAREAGGANGDDAAAGPTARDGPAGDWTAPNRDYALAAQGNPGQRAPASTYPRDPEGGHYVRLNVAPLPVTTLKKPDVSLACDVRKARVKTAWVAPKPGAEPELVVLFTDERGQVY